MKVREVIHVELGHRWKCWEKKKLAAPEVFGAVRQKVIGEFAELPICSWNLRGVLGRILLERFKRRSGA